MTGWRRESGNARCETWGDIKTYNTRTYLRADVYKLIKKTSDGYGSVFFFKFITIFFTFNGCSLIILEVTAEVSGKKIWNVSIFVYGIFFYFFLYKYNRMYF